MSDELDADDLRAIAKLVDGMNELLPMVVGDDAHLTLWAEREPTIFIEGDVVGHLATNEDGKYVYQRKGE